MRMPRNVHEDDGYSTNCGKILNLCWDNRNKDNLAYHIEKDWDGEERWVQFIDNTGRKIVTKISGELTVNENKSVCINRITLTGETQQVTIFEDMPLTDTPKNNLNQSRFGKTDEFVAGSVFNITSAYGNDDTETAKGVPLSTSNGNITDIDKYLELAEGKDYYVEPFFLIYKDYPALIYLVDHAHINYIEREKDGRLLCEFYLTYVAAHFGDDGRRYFKAYVQEG